jgi:arylsulfatase A-like enzyme
MTNKGAIDRVILILMDDVRASHLFDLMHNGKLPNLAKLARDGISCQNCVTSFPSITFPCYSNILLGAYSGYYPKDGSGIPMYHWVGRSDPPTEEERFPAIHNYGTARHIRKINTDIGVNVKTIFEQAGEGNFLSSLNLINRGSTFVPPEEYTTASILKTVENTFKNPKQFQFDEAPIVTVAYVPKTDDLMHNRGFDHPEYINEIIKADTGIGNIIQTLKETGYYDSTAIGIISDHGNYKTEKMHDLEPFFNEVGLTQYNPKNGTGDFDANFGCVGFFNFHGKNWHLHPTIEEMKDFKLSRTGKSNIDIFKTLWKIPGVKYMYYRDDSNTPDKGTIHIRYRDEGFQIHEGRIEYEDHGKNQKTKYVFENLELYGYERDERSAVLLNGKFHDINSWLEGTNHIDFPMIIDQIPRYFKNPRSCDIIISTLGIDGFSYEHGKTVAPHQYSHDICLRKSMVVPFIIGGSPELPTTELPYCKTTDMVPSLLRLLGKKPHKSVVGKSII